MSITLPDARQLPDDVLAALRLRAVRGIELGFRECDLAELLGVSPQTVCHWWTASTSGGLDAIPGDRTGRPVGSGRTLTDEQASRLQQRIDDQSPEELGIASPLWTRRAVRDLILREYGIRMPVRTVGEYLKRWGYTAKRPRRHARLLRAAERKVFLIVDRLSAHDNDKVAGWGKDHGEQIELFYLPRRSPELNPDEYLNNDLKGRGNEEGLPNSKEDLRSRIHGFMRTLVHWPGQVMSYFLHPCVLYAAGP